MSQEIVFIGFGSNLGDRQELCDRALALMHLLPLSHVSRVSSYYETQPVDPQGTLGPNWFYNGVVRLETSLNSRHLFAILQETERGLGREDGHRDGPRTIDLDILLYGQHEIQETGLKIPHPRLHLRRFVLEPLVEIDPTYVHPTLHRSFKELLDNLKDSSKVKKLSMKPGMKYPSPPICSVPPS